MSLQFGSGAAGLVLWLPLTWLAWRIYTGTRPAASRRVTWLLLGLRTLVLGALLLVIAEPTLKRWRQRLVRPGLVVLLDVSASMGIAEQDTARLARALQVLQLDAFRRAALDGVSVRAWQFAEEAQPLGLDSLDAVRAQGRATDLAGALQAALEQDEQRADLRALLVVTDGAHNLGADPVAVAQGAGLPVFGLTVGGETPPPDVQIAAVTPPGTAYAGEDLELQVSVRSWGYAGRPARLELRQNDQVLQHQTLPLAADGAIAVATLTVPDPVAGAQIYRVTVPTWPGEASEDNNEALVEVDVQGQRLRVLLLAGAPSPETAFLRRALADDPGLEVQLHTSGAVQLSMQADGRRPDQAPVLEPWDQWDAVALVDPHPGMLSQAAAQRLVAWVHEGGGLLWLPGPRFVDSWRGGLGLEDVLLVQLPAAVRWSAEEAPATRTAAGQRHPVTRLSGHASGPDPWQRLPPLPGFLPVEELPAASTVLLARAASGSEPLLVAGPVGSGRVLACLSAGFWRLDLLSSGAGQDPRPVRDMWRNGLRWLGTRAAGARLRLWSERRVFRAGARLGFAAHVVDELLRPQPGAEVMTRIMPGDVRVPLVDRGGGNYGATWPSLDPGEYRFVATAAVAGEAVGADSGAFIIEPYSLESVDVRAHPELVGDVARAAGGAARPLAQWEELVTQLPLQQRLEQEQLAVSLWPRAWCLAGILGLMVLEWGLRKRHGMI